MSLQRAVSVVYDVMDELGLTKLDKGRVLSEIANAGPFSQLSEQAQRVWDKVNERLAKAGIAVADTRDDDGA